MIIRNCFELLSELAELESKVQEKQELLEQLGVDVDCEELLLQFISKQRAL